MKSYFYLNFKIFFIFLLTTCSYATASSDLTHLLNRLKTMKADFVEVIYDNHGKAIQKSHGQMALDRPGKFRWQVKKPIPQLIIANQQRLWIYDPDLEQVTIRLLKKETGDAPALLLSHVNTVLEKEYNVKALAHKSPQWKYFRLTPRKNDSMFESIVMGFKDDHIGKMSLVDHLGHSTAIEFHNAVFNQSLSDQLFTFRSTGKIDVINETRS